MKTVMLLLCLSSTAWAIEYREFTEQDLPNPAKKITLDGQGNWLELTVNEWKDVVETKEGKQKRIFTQGYNYQKRQGFIRVHSFQGELLNETYSEEYDGMVTREEMMLAYDLFKKHEVNRKVLEQQNEPIELQGGFNYADQGKGQPCSIGLRCVHVFASTPSKPLILHSVVRLTDQTIPYPEFNLHLKKQKNKTIIKKRTTK